MMIFFIAIALVIVMALFVVLGAIIMILNKELSGYKTAACLSMGKLGRLYRSCDDIGIRYRLFDVWRATEVYVPEDDLDVISNCFYKE